VTFRSWKGTHFGYPALAVAIGLVVVLLSPSAMGWSATPESGLPSSVPAGPLSSALPTPAQGTSPARVTLVPAPSGTSSGCVVASPSSLYPTLREGYLSFNGNLFNLPSGSVGETNLCYNATSATLSDATSFSQLPGAPQHGVLGYPEAIYGENIYGGPAGTTNSALPLPHDQVQNLTAADVWVDLNYSVTAPGGSPYDFAWDDWFSVLPANSTSTGNVGNRIELMIWYSNDIGMYLPQTRIDLPSFVNGAPAPGAWYLDHLCMGSNDITFDALYSANGDTPGYGLSSGQIALNLTELLNNISATMRAGACWASPGTDIGGLYMDNSPLGAEFYPTTSDTANVSWSVSSLCYTFVAGVPSASGVSCESNAISPLSLKLSGTPESGPAPLSVKFVATATGGTAPYTYGWTFGDGGTAGNDSTAVHTYDRAGEFPANATVSDVRSNHASASVSVTVSVPSSGNPGLSLVLSGTPGSGPAPLAIQFAVSATGGTVPYTYLWTFGDGDSATNTSIETHTYAHAGKFVAQVTVSDAHGTISSASVTVNVSGPIAPAAASVSPVLIFGLALGAALAAGTAAFVAVRARRRA
jgi:PKD repeat protein